MPDADFFDLPTIPLQNICRIANVSGLTAKARLERAGSDIALHQTPTGRTLLTPNDGRRLFELLTNPS